MKRKQSSLLLIIILIILTAFFTACSSSSPLPSISEISEGTVSEKYSEGDESDMSENSSRYRSVDGSDVTEVSVPDSDSNDASRITVSAIQSSGTVSSSDDRSSGNSSEISGTVSEGPNSEVEDDQYLPFANAYRLLTTGDKKLTIGYIGGSITYGVSAERKYNGDGTFSVSGGDIMLSWVNKTSSWFKKEFPEATIETVNAGVSDTATNFGLFRLEKTLMNSVGHDMPDLVFVEFTVNDWIYKTQNTIDLQRQVESVFLNIYKSNPLAEIVVAITARSSTDARRAHIAVARHYGVPYVDMGIPMQELMTLRGNANESAGNYYYTVDNLHPSNFGYEVYFEAVQEMLETRFDALDVKSSVLYNLSENLPRRKNDFLITDPAVIPAVDFDLSGNAVAVSEATVCKMYGTGYSQINNELLPRRVHVKSDDAFASFSFTGTALGFMFQMSTKDINMSYRIDNSEWKVFKVDESSFAFQRYDHAQVFMLAHMLAYKTHSVELKFNKSGDQEVDVKLVAALVGGEEQ